MCVSSPPRNVTIRRQGKARRHDEHRHSKRKWRSRGGDESICDDAEEELITHYMYVLDDEKADGDETRCSHRSLVLAPTASLSEDDEDDLCLCVAGEERRPSPAERRITDEHDIAACRRATQGLQSELPQCSPGSETDGQAASSEVKPIELFHSPRTNVPNHAERSWLEKMHSAAFALLGLLELGGAFGYFSDSEAVIINSWFLFTVIIHHISRAKAAAFSYTGESTQTKRASRRSFDPSDCRKNSKQYWSGERVHLFVSFLLFRAIILLPIFREANIGPTAIHSIAETSLMKTRGALLQQIKQFFAVMKNYLSREIIALALTNPLKLRLRLRQLATYIRWAKFLAPLVGTLNKLKGHSFDLHRKWAQRRRSRRARRNWEETISALRTQRRFEATILRIQRNFRSRRETKSKKRMKLINDRRGTTQSSRKIHQRLKREATQARLGIAKIDMIRDENSKLRMISAKDRRQMMKHKDGERGRRVFLLRPNTNFAVLWKFITVTCVLLECISLTLAPKLTGEMRKLEVQAFARICAVSIQSSNPTIWKRLWAVSAAQLAEFLAAAVPAVSFVGVFVEFFTGEFSDTGMLVPKPFFSRWIVPGVFLQLLVNPSMRSIGTNVHFLALEAQSMGLARVLSLILAFRPILEMIWGLMMETLHRFIEIQNRNISMFG